MLGLPPTVIRSPLMFCFLEIYVGTVFAVEVPIQTRAESPALVDTLYARVRAAPTLPSASVAIIVEVPISYQVQVLQVWYCRLPMVPVAVGTAK